MTLRKKQLHDLPDWPQAMTRDVAAAYLMMSINSFDTHVDIDPIRVGGIERWHRAAIDRWLENRNGNQSDFTDRF